MTMVRSDIYTKFKDSSSVAYCHQGQYFGSLAFYNNETDSVMILLPKSYLLEESHIQQIEEYSMSLPFHNFELWTFIHEIDEPEIQQQAVNRLYDVYCSFYSSMEYMRNASFRGFNE